MRLLACGTCLMIISLPTCRGNHASPITSATCYWYGGDEQ
ncbi:hypothetical protein SEVIR_9G462801v4 [Setaria viridis]